MNIEGSIEQLPSGRWRVRVTIEGRRRTLGTFATRALAESRLRAFRREVTDGTIEVPTGVTLAGYGHDVIDEREVNGSEHRVAVKGAENERSLWRRHVAPSVLGELQIDAVDQIAVRDFRTWLRSRVATRAISIQPRAIWSRVLEHRPPNASARYRRARGAALLVPEAGRKTVHRPTSKPISRQTQSHVLRILRAVLQHAVTEGVIATNPATEVRAAPSIVRSRDFNEDWLRGDEIDRLLACEQISAFDRRAYACAIGLSLRLNDLKSIERAHVHLDVEIPGPHIAVAIGKADGRAHRVPIMPWLVPVVREQLAASKGSRWLFPNRDKERYHKDHDFGWAEKRETGRPRRPGALEVAGVARRIRFHDLRGTTATHLALGTWGRSWSLHEIQAMLAHTDQRVTERYVRRALDMLAEAARATTEGPRMAPASVHVGPRQGEISDAASAAKYPESLVTSSPRFERGTFGSGGTRDSEASPTLPSGVDRVVDRVSPRSLLVRQAACAALETADPSSMLALALEVLGEALSAPADEVRLALEVRDAGTPHRARRAIELAELVIDRIDAELAAARDADA